MQTLREETLCFALTLILTAGAVVHFNHWEPAVEAQVFSTAQPEPPPPALSGHAPLPEVPVEQGSSTGAPIELALVRSQWPPELWPRVVEIARCESQHDNLAIGDGGLALGLMQVRIDAHPDLAATHDLWSYDGSLAASWIIYLRAGRSFAPWSCS